MKWKSCLYLLWICMVMESRGQSKTYSASSPDKTTRMEIKVDGQGKLVYRVFFAAQPVTAWSALGFTLNHTIAGEQTRVNDHKQQRHSETFAWPLGENDSIRSVYQELTLSCLSSTLQFQVMARVFDGSVAFRYEVPGQPGLDSGIIKRENTQFDFLAPYTIYQYHHETVFTPGAIDTFNTPCDFPATLSDGKLYISIGEAANDSYTKAELRRGTVPHSLYPAFVRDSVVKTKGAFKIPWRTISFSKTAIGLHRYSQLFMKLNPPPENGMPSGIKPGKLIRSQLNTQSALDCIDFAHRNNFQYIMFDAGWYGAEFRSTSDPTTPIPQIDMAKVIQYGKVKGIGVILYVNYVGLRAKLDTLLPLYKAWGVSGFKFGFVDGITQAGINWLVSAIKKVNEYGFVLNIHDNYNPTGLSRTYPVLLTQEGIRGNENSPDAFHTTVLPFTRFLAGAGDYTYVYPNAKNNFAKHFLVSKGHQLALTVVYFSPLQAMFWYGQPNDYTNETDIEFFKLVPTVWNESVYLAGEIGKNISVARRKGDTWFVGNAAGLEGWRGAVRLHFLEKGKNYLATVFEDDGQGNIRKRSVQVKKGDLFPFDLKEKGGQALMIEVR